MKFSFKKIFIIMEGFIAYIQLIKDPKKLDRVIEISQKIGTEEVLTKVGNHVASLSPIAKKALEERPRINLATLYQESESLPENSLGSQFLRFLKERNLNPADIPRLEANNSSRFVQAHLYETHDLWHVICGFDTDVAGELGLQAFYLFQTGSPLSALLIAAGLINTAFFALEDRAHRMNEIHRGWSLALKAKPLFGVNWNEFWQMPLSEVRVQFGVT